MHSIIKKGAWDYLSNEEKANIQVLASKIDELIQTHLEEIKQGRDERTAPWFLYGTTDSLAYQLLHKNNHIISALVLIFSKHDIHIGFRKMHTGIEIQVIFFITTSQHH